MKIRFLFVIISLLLNVENSFAKSLKQLGLIFTLEPGWKATKQVSNGEYYAPSSSNNEMLIYSGTFTYPENQHVTMDEALNFYNATFKLICPSYQTSKPAIQLIQNYYTANFYLLCKDKGEITKYFFTFGDEGVRELSIGFHSNDYVNKDIDSVTLSDNHLKLVDSLFKSIKICDIQDPKIENCQGVVK